MPRQFWIGKSKNQDTQRNKAHLSLLNNSWQFVLLAHLVLFTPVRASRFASAARPSRALRIQFFVPQSPQSPFFPLSPSKYATLQSVRQIFFLLIRAANPHPPLWMPRIPRAPRLSVYFQRAGK